MLANAQVATFWQELWADLGGTAMILQGAVILASLCGAWLLSALMQSRIVQWGSSTWRLGVGGIERVLFPLVALSLVYLGKTILRHWQHTSLLTLVATLLMAMVVIRLAAYALRTIFSPSGLMGATEHFIAATIWSIVALHLTGLLPEIIETLDNLSFSLGAHRYSVLLLIQSVCIAVVTLIITLWAGRILEGRLMGADQLDINLRVVLSKLLRVILIVVGVLSALSVVGFDITLLSVFGGALGVGLGFGLQKIASNYVSGFILLLDSSLRLGDVMTVDGHYGVVHQLRARYLLLRKLDGTEIVIPNDTLITSTVINHSLTDRTVQIHLGVQVSYDSNLEVAMQLMRSAAADTVRVLAQPAADVAIKALGENGIQLDLSLWINDPENGFGSVQSAIYMKILQSFRVHGIHIPSQQRDVRMVDSALA